MATRYAPVARCVELPEREVLAALLSREECGRVLTRIASMAQARSAARALAALVARLATPACTWLEGSLAVELFEELGSDDAPSTSSTTIRVMSELGAGLRERVLPALVIAEPLAEVVAAFERRRDLMTYARIERVSGRCALVVASEDDGPDSSGLAVFEISETSLAFQPAVTPSSASATVAVARAHDGRLPDDVDAGWDEVAAS